LKLVKVFTIVLLALFAVSVQSDAGFIKNLKKKVTHDKNDKKDKKNKTAETKEPEKVKYDYEMTENSDRDADIKKLLPAKSEYNHRITEGVFGPADGSKGNILIVPYVTGGNGKVQLMLLIPAETQKYNKTMLGEIRFGKYAVQEVESVFFDQADKDKERELFVICYVMKGKRGFTETAVYDWNKTKYQRVPSMESEIKDLSPAITVRRKLRAMEN